MTVAKQSDVYATYTRDDFFRDDMERRDAGSESAGVDFTPSQDSYRTDKFALHIDVDYDTQANADNPAHDPMRDAVRVLTQKELIKRDREWQTAFFGTGVWGTDLTGGTDFIQISDAASDPIRFVGEQKLAIEDATGLEARDLVISAKGWLDLMNHPDLVGRVDRGQTTGGATVSLATAAALLDLDRIHVARGVYNTAQKGEALSMARINSNDALLCYVDPNPGLYSPTAGMTFVWNAPGTGAEGRSINTMDIPMRQATRVEIEARWDMKVVAPELGVFMSGFTAA
jgi:hypothetical protein